MQNWPDDIPKSDLTENNTIVGDLSTPDGNLTTLFLNPNCVVLGLNDDIHTLFITPYFDFQKLPSTIGTSIYNIKNLILQSTFSADSSKHIEHYPIPAWLKDFVKLNELRLKSADLTKLDGLMELPIERLTLRDIYYVDEQNFLIDILRFKSLNEITYDESFPLNLKEAIIAQNIKLIQYVE